MRLFSNIGNRYLEHRFLRNRKVLAELLDVYYTERHRRYHTTEHIMKCLELYDTFGTWNLNMNLPYNKELILAILFHDIVYTIGSTDNEKKSADFAFEYGRYFVNESSGHPLDVIDWEKLKEIIMATVHDGKEIPSLAARYMVNFDLYTLGSSRQQYIESSSAIKSEFMEKYTVKEFKYGRNLFLESMIARPSIFYPLDNPMLDVIFQKVNERAKANMIDEIQRLEKM